MLQTQETHVAGCEVNVNNKKYVHVVHHQTQMPYIAVIARIFEVVNHVSETNTFFYNNTMMFTGTMFCLDVIFSITY